MKFSANVALSLSLLGSAVPGLNQAGQPVLSAQPTATAPVQTPQGTSGAAAAPIVGADYIIGSDDSLAVSVWEQPQLTGQVLVRPDGNISLPLIGDVRAAGLTPLQLGANIAERLKAKYVKDPTVNVAVLSVNSKAVIMIGEVGRVGPIPMRPGMTVLQAIVTAGGLGPFANKKKIYILRGEPGHQQRLPFNYKRSLLNDDMLVQPGDRIVVPD